MQLIRCAHALELELRPKGPQTFRDRVMQEDAVDITAAGPLRLRAVHLDAGQQRPCNHLAELRNSPTLALLAYDTQVPTQESSVLFHPSRMLASSQRSVFVSQSFLRSDSKVDWLSSEKPARRLAMSSIHLSSRRLNDWPPDQSARLGKPAGQLICPCKNQINTCELCSFQWATTWPIDWRRLSREQLAGSIVVAPLNRSARHLIGPCELAGTCLARTRLLALAVGQFKGNLSISICNQHRERVLTLGS